MASIRIAADIIPPTGAETQAWYLPTDPSRNTNLAKEAFEQALDTLKTEVKGRDLAYQWINTPVTIHDIAVIVSTAQKQYQKRSESKQRITLWLTKLASRITYYGKVFDMLAQHHPEYVSLAWGTMKFVFIGIINHETLLVEIAKALITIGDVLPQTKLHADLYQTQTMQDAVSRLYAHIILFFQDALKWYNRGPAGRAMASIFNPFELHYEEAVKQIKACSHTVEQIANAASRAEIRDISVLSRHQHKDSQARDQKLEAMQSQMVVMQRRFDDRLDELLKVSINHQSITQAVHLDIGDMKPRIHEIHFAQIIGFLKPSTSPEASLIKTQSLVQRSQITNLSPRAFSEPLTKLSHWLVSSKSSMFLLKVGPRAEIHAKSFAMGIISLLKTCPVPLIWNFSTNCTDSARYGLKTLLKSLVYQSLKYSPAKISSSFDQLNIARLQDTHTDAKWFDLLMSILSTIPKCFMVLEIDGLHKSDQEACDRLISMLKAHLTGSRMILRTLIIPFVPAASHDLEVLSDQIFTATVQQAPIITARSRKFAPVPVRQSPWWQQVNVDHSRL